MLRAYHDDDEDGVLLGLGCIRRTRRLLVGMVRVRLRLGHVVVVVVVVVANKYRVATA